MFEGAIACFLYGGLSSFENCNLRNCLSRLSHKGIAIQRVLARQLAEEMKLKKIAKTEMATKMQTSRAQLDCLLDPAKTGVLIGTIQQGSLDY
jgi:hypothetical protein